MRILFVQQENAPAIDYFQHVIADAIGNKYRLPWIESKINEPQPTNKNALNYVIAPDKKGIPCVLWYRKLRSFISKAQYDTVIWSNGYCLENIPTKQIVLFGTVSFLKGKKELKDWQQFSKKHIAATLHNAFSIVTTNSEAKSFIQQWYKRNVYIQYASPLSHPTEIGWTDKNNFLDTHTEGDQYFVSLIDDNIDTTIALLKSFSLFKKWQRSTFKLCLLSDNQQTIELITEKVATYAYRESIKIIHSKSIDTLSTWISHAYGNILLSEQEEKTTSILLATFFAIPGIYLRNNITTEIVNENAFLIVPEENSIESIGQTLISMYKAENIYTSIVNRLTERANELAQIMHAPEWLQDI